MAAEAQPNPADACLSTLHSKIDPSELAAKMMGAGSDSRATFCIRKGADRRRGLGALVAYVLLY